MQDADKASCVHRELKSVTYVVKRKFSYSSLPIYGARITNGERKTFAQFPQLGLSRNRQFITINID